MKGLMFITHQTDQFDYLDTVRIALEGGCRHIQLRMKGASLCEVERTAGQALEMCTRYGAKLYVNDHVLISAKLGTAGVHLGKNDLTPTEARRILGEKVLIGGTANTYEEICRLKKEGVDYVGLGPFRFTATKSDLSPILGISGYEQILYKCFKNELNIPIFAIGGIHFNDIPVLMLTGITGIALSSSILETEHPVEETKRILNRINTYIK